MDNDLYSLFYTALTVLPEAIIIIDDQQVVRFINPAANSLLEFGDEVIAIDTLTTLLRRVQIILPNLLNIKSPASAFYEEVTSTDTGQRIRFRVTPLSGGAQGTQIGALIRIEEVTLEWTANDLLQAFFNESLAPLHSMKGFAELLLQDTASQLTDLQREIVTAINRNVQRLLILRDDMLETMRELHQKSERA